MGSGKSCTASRKRCTVTQHVSIIFGIATLTHPTRPVTVTVTAAALQRTRDVPILYDRRQLEDMIWYPVKNALLPKLAKVTARSRARLHSNNW
jgi:hypothetical protein